MYRDTSKELILFISVRSLLDELIIGYAERSWINYRM